MSFPRYPKYKPSGVEWLGDVPEGWDVKRFRFCVRSSNAGEVIDRSYWHSGDELFFSCQRDAMSSNFSEFPLWKRTSDRDLLVTRNATPYVHTPPANSIYSNVVQRCILNDGLLRSFVALSLETVCSRLREDGYGVSIPSFSYEKWCNLHLALPPLAEQTAIAEFLDRETAKIDGLVAEQRRLMELLKEKRQAVISHAVTKGLNPHAPMKPSGIEWLGDVPVGWEILPLRRVVNKFVDYRGKTPSQTDAGIPLVTATAVRNNKIDHSRSPAYISQETYDEWMVRGFPEVGDVVFTTEGATFGETGQIVDASIALAQRLILFKVNSCKILNDYLFYHFLSDFGRFEQWRNTTGSTVFGIRADKLKALKTVVPPLNVQKAILSYIEEIICQFEPIESEAQRAIDLLQERRTALISAAVTGQIDVRPPPKN